MNLIDSRCGFFDEVIFEYMRRLLLFFQYMSGGFSFSIVIVFEIFFNIVCYVFDYKEEEVIKMDFIYFNDIDCFKLS